jgi:hypothetical protein
MKVLKIILTLFVGLGSTLTFEKAVAADNWVRYEANETADTFLDIDSVRSIDGVTSYRILQNFKQRQQLTPLLSVVTLLEMKCADKRARYIRGTSYSERFGKGQVVGTLTAAMLGQSATEFSPIANAQIDQFPLVCKR